MFLQDLVKDPQLRYITQSISYVRLTNCDDCNKFLDHDNDDGLCKDCANQREIDDENEWCRLQERKIMLRNR